MQNSITYHYGFYTCVPASYRGYRYVRTYNLPIDPVKLNKNIVFNLGMWYVSIVNEDGVIYNVFQSSMSDFRRFFMLRLKYVFL